MDLVITHLSFLAHQKFEDAAVFVEQDNTTEIEIELR